jgi:hypothetical protein
MMQKMILVIAHSMNSFFLNVGVVLLDLNCLFSRKWQLYTKISK